MAVVAFHVLTIPVEINAFTRAYGFLTRYGVLTVQDRVLTISGERKEEQEEQRGGYYVRERKRGSFRRSMTLPEGVDEDRIQARYENGVLEVTIEGSAAAREPRRIPVDAGDKGLLDRARDAILGEEEEPRRREGTGRPEDRRTN
jgi:hypothetical protein